MLPKELGGLSPSGMYMANVMAYDILRESGLLFIHGGAFQLDGRTVCIFSPSQTGKTTVISKLIQNGAKYLGEDAILTDRKIVHLVPPHKLDKFGVLSKDDIMRYSKIDCAYICDYGKKNGGDKRSKAISYLRILSNRVPFHNDGLVQALIAYQGQDFRDLENKAVDVVERLVDNADVRFISNLNEMAADLDGC
jgi:hypothetical protein